MQPMNLARVLYPAVWPSAQPATTKAKKKKVAGVTLMMMLLSGKQGGEGRGGGPNIKGNGITDMLNQSPTKLYEGDV